MVHLYSEFLRENVSNKDRFRYGSKNPKWASKMTHTYEDEVKSALYDYVAGYTTEVNNYLRGGLEKVCEPITSLLDQAFVTKKKIDVYRTVDTDYFTNVHGFDVNDPQALVGTVITNKGYMSTSYELQSPWSGSWFEDDIILHITSDKPYPYIDINSVFDADEIDCEEQKEYLLPRNTKMEVVSITKVNSKQDKRFDKNGNYFVELKIV